MSDPKYPYRAKTVEINSLNIKEMLFNVNEDNSVDICLGPFKINVCDHPEDFEDFIENIIFRLNTIQEEIKQNYYQN